jgi:hypothetical protein
MPKQKQLALPDTTPAIPSAELTPMELHAVARVGKGAEKVRDHLADDHFELIDVTLRIKGSMTVGVPELREKTVKPDAVELLALVFEMLPAGQRRVLEKRLDSAYQLADTEARPEQQPAFRILAEQAIARWTKKDERVQRGAVTGTVAAEVLYRGSL